MNASKHDDGEDRVVAIHDPQVPGDVRQAILRMKLPACTLYRCPRRWAPHGLLSVFGIGRRDIVIEWWLYDADDELVEVFY